MTRPTSLVLALTLTLTLTLSLTSACGDATPPPSSIDPAGMDLTVDPCQDFYTYACGGWIAKHPLPPDASANSRFNDPFYAMTPILRDIIQRDATGAPMADDPDGQIVGRYYQSCMDAPHNATARAALSPMLTAIIQIESLDDLAREAAAQRQAGSGTLFSNGVTRDLDDPNRHAVFIDQGGVELARYHYIDTEEAPHLVAYRQHIARLASYFPAIAIDPDQVVQIETALARAAQDPEDRGDPRALHHPMSVAEAAALAPTFPWTTYWQAMGLGDLEIVDVNEPAYLAALDAVLQSTPLASLKMYMAWQLIQDKASRLDDPILTAEFDFWQRVINGINQTQPRSWTCYLDTQRRLGMSVSRPYIARQYPGSTTTEVEAITKDMRGAFSRRIAAAEWIDAQTQGEAQAKLTSIGDKIGHPDHWPTLDGLSLSGTFLDFDLEMDQWFSQNNLNARAQPVDHGAWSAPPITVNAFYSDGDNAITIPAGILQPPFFGHGYSAVSNYGAIGAVLGHELTHGFDNRGRLFDSAGALRDWWTPDTAAAFDARAQCVVDQYSSYTVLPGVNVDGRQTLPENLADIGGLNVAYDAWVASGRHEGDRGGLDDRQQFFVAFAQMYCEVARDELLISLAATDVHSPNRARVNLALSNVPGAAQAFSCAAGTPLAPAEPCVVW